jgi:hypothetical protein
MPPVDCNIGDYTQLPVPAAVSLEDALLLPKTPSSPPTLVPSPLPTTLSTKTDIPDAMSNANDANAFEDNSYVIDTQTSFADKLEKEGAGINPAATKEKGNPKATEDDYQ